MSIESALNQVVQQAQAAQSVAPDDYKDPKTGLLMCGKCHTPKQYHFHNAAFDLGLVPVMCDCQRAAHDAAAAPQNVQNAPAETVKRIILELVGKGTIEVSGGSGSGLTENEVLELLTDNMKPVLMGIIKQEIFEEGQLSYEY